MNTAVKPLVHTGLRARIYEELIPFLCALRKKEYREARKSAEEISRLTAALAGEEQTESTSGDLSGAR